VLGESVFGLVASLARESGLEEHLGAADEFFTDHNFVLVGKLVDFGSAVAFVGSLELSIEIRGNLSVLDLHLLTLLEDFGVSDGVSLWINVKAEASVVPLLLPELEHVLGEVLTTDVYFGGGVGNSETLIDRYSVCNTVSRINDSSSSPSSGKQTHYSLVSEVELGDLVLFKTKIEEKLNNLNFEYCNLQ
jgi:hypothetical protein